MAEKFNYSDKVNLDKVKKAIQNKKVASKDAKAFASFNKQICKELPYSMKPSEVKLFLMLYFTVVRDSLISGLEISIPKYFKKAKIYLRRSKRSKSMEILVSNQSLVEINSESDYEELYQLE